MALPFKMLSGGGGGLMNSILGTVLPVAGAYFGYQFLTAEEAVAGQDNGKDSKLSKDFASKDRKKEAARQLPSGDMQLIPGHKPVFE